MLSTLQSQKLIYTCCFSWEGKGEAEVGKNSETQDVVVRIDPKYYRPTEVEQLLGDPAKATKKLGWKRECDFDVRIIDLYSSLLF